MNQLHHKTWHQKHRDSLSIGQRVADSLAAVIGSWKFIVTQAFLVLLWVVINLIAYLRHWDPYPFILLNLLFSTQAAFAAPIIMMSQNRQNDRDRHQALEDFETNVRAKEEIEFLQRELARIEQVKLDKILAILDERKNGK